MNRQYLANDEIIYIFWFFSFCCLFHSILRIQRILMLALGKNCVTTTNPD